ncbi:GNAT family N-acetyltransferase [Undibacterium sp.]|uniref:GNAT family N-acetyltransferase n=1 Tax=Undibacterium sp. TaxID=1914977 RepID=UPI0025F5B011|nr:GNAT family N-acetyltransferase [Undibacterium sp.]MCX7219068.1 GNAT family N-acetyltransferase [Burkholderiales bacterium]
MRELVWVNDASKVDWEALSALYKIALGEKSAENLAIVFANSKFKHFIYDGERLIGAGRALADGVDCAYLCDIAILPEYQGQALGKAMVNKLLADAAGHKKVILYANPGKEAFYKKLGFCKMNTAMAIFSNQELALASGLLSAD